MCKDKCLYYNNQIVLEKKQKKLFLFIVIGSVASLVLLKYLMSIL